VVVGDLIGSGEAQERGIVGYADPRSIGQNHCVEVLGQHHRRRSSMELILITVALVLLFGGGGGY